MIETIIIILLIIGSFSDYKWLWVSDKISHSVAILSLFLLQYNPTFFYFQVGMSLFLILAWHKKQYGSADVKVLVPLMFAFPEVYPLLFLSIICLVRFILFFYFRQNKIPEFIPITAGHIITYIIFNHSIN